MFGGNTLRKYWKKQYKKDEAELRDLAADDYPLTAPLDNLDSAAEDEVRSGIDVLAGGGDRELARTFFQRGVTIAERVLGSSGADSLERSPGFPFNRGIALRAEVYARTAAGESMDTARLRKASKDFATHARSFSDPSDPYQNNEQCRYYWIDAVQSALIGGDVERASQLMEDVPRPIKYNKRHFDLLSRLVELVANDAAQSERDKFIADFDKFFDDVRDPRIQPQAKEYRPDTIAALELAMLRDLYLVNPGVPLDFDRVINDYGK